MKSNNSRLLALCDFAGMDEDQIKLKIDEDFETSGLDPLDEVIVAYMSVGAYGCDSDALIIYRREGRLYEVNGSHCSCYGFEGQWDPELIGTLEEVVSRADWLLAGGGYDSDRTANAKAIREHLSKHWLELQRY